MSELVFANGMIIDGVHDQPIGRGYIRVSHDKIKEVGRGHPSSSEGAEIDLRGCTVLPGLIDCHVHLVWDGSPDPAKKIQGLPEPRVALLAYSNARKTLELGITTVRDLGSPGRTVLDLAQVIREGALIGPNILSAGPALCMTGGHGHYMSYEVDGVDNVRAAARRVMKEGADLVKIMASGGIYTEGEEPGSPQYTVEEMKAAVTEAHKRQRAVAAHAEGLAGIRNALEAGVDTIEHGIFADDDCLRRMKERGTPLVPTMAVMRRLASDPRIPSFAQQKARLVTEAHIAMLRRAVTIGVPIATGTDAGSPCSPPDVYFEELDIMAEAGMKPMEILKASTSVAAQVIKRPNLGALQQGKQADLIAVEGDPLKRLSDLRNVRLVVISGQVFRDILEA
jgi:imidazolonepropionase-like amidohydrolase